MGISLATFNLKDFFPDPRGDFGAKVAWTAEMIARAGADVVAMQEVGPSETVDALLAALRSHGAEYASSIVGTPDARGIRCALISRLPVNASRVFTSDALPFPVFRVGDPPPFGARLPLRRGVVIATLDAGALGRVTAIVAHFKSRRAVPLTTATGEIVVATTASMRADAEVRSMAWRAAEALCVRGLVDEALANDVDARVAVMGDLNDTIDSTTLRIVMGRGSGAGELRSCGDVVDAAARFSILHDGGRSQIDHLLVSSPLFARLRDARFLNEALREHAFVPSQESRAVAARANVAAPAPADPPPTIDSDHAPFVARFE